MLATMVVWWWWWWFVYSAMAGCPPVAVRQSVVIAVVNKRDFGRVRYPQFLIMSSLCDSVGTCKKVRNIVYKRSILRIFLKRILLSNHYLYKYSYFVRQIDEVMIELPGQPK